MRALLILLALGCAPKAPPPVEAPAPPPAPEYVPVPPTPLAPRPFTPSTASRGALANGLPVIVVENHEVPLVTLRIDFLVRGGDVPAAKAGLAEATMDMLNEGAGKRDALAISAELQRLGASLGTGAGYDGASVSISCLRDKLEPTLDVLADVLLRPTFPAAEWERRKSLWIDDLQDARNSPGRIASRVTDRILWGKSYRGVEADERSLAAITLKDMKAWHAANLGPAGAVVQVGGDVTLAEVTPMLEARFGAWKGKSAPLGKPPVPPAPPAKTTVWLVDKPGAEQSVVRAVTYAGKPTDPDYAAFTLANNAMGGQFASRINLDLREQKGYTYGARTSVSYDLAGVSWSFSANIHTDKTALALQALFEQLRSVEAGAPLTEKEIEEARGAVLGGWPLRFESPDYLLGQLDAMRTYGLPETWVSGYVARMRAPSAADAQKAWADRIDPDRLRFVVVGDAAKVRSEIENLGIVVIPVDADGNAIGGK